MKTIAIISVLIFSLITIPGCDIKEKEDDKNKVTDNASTHSVGIKKIGYIIGLIEKNNQNYMQIDMIEFFTGDKAKKAVELDSKNNSYNPGIELANGYYIKNVEKDISEFRIDDNIEITMQTFSFDSTGNFYFNEKINYDSFSSLFDSNESNRFKHIPFWFEIRDGIIISIKEQYIP